MNSSIVVILRVFTESIENSLGGLNGHVGVSTLSRARTNFLVIEEHDQIDLSIVMALLQVLLGVTNDSVKGAETTSKVIQTRRRNEFIMHTDKTGLLRIAAGKFEVNDLVRFTSDILGHHVNERAEMLVTNIVVIVLTWLNIFIEQLRDNISGKNRLQVSFLVGLEFIRSIQMDGKTWDLHKGLSSVPVSALQLTISMDNDFTSQSQVSIEPSSPKTATISHNIKLLVSKTIV
mmetsp:Transcript_64259/g.88883  ORF Transcript_64259/g.88883 Transcript_64259/m.88883 type:complete len:233 (+) Transcript_64259:467-1165(+)